MRIKKIWISPLYSAVIDKVLDAIVDLYNSNQHITFRFFDEKRDLDYFLMAMSDAGIIRKEQKEIDLKDPSSYSKEDLFVTNYEFDTDNGLVKIRVEHKFSPTRTIYEVTYAGETYSYWLEEHFKPFGYEDKSFRWLFDSFSIEVEVAKENINEYYFHNMLCDRFSEPFNVKYYDYLPTDIFIGLSNGSITLGEGFISGDTYSINKNNVLMGGQKVNDEHLLTNEEMLLSLIEDPSPLKIAAKYSQRFSRLFQEINKYRTEKGIC